MNRHLVSVITITTITYMFFIKLAHAGGFPREGFAEIIEKASLAIVYIEEYGAHNKFTSTVGEADEIPFVEEETVGHGSGFLVSNTGYILTNRHVVKNITKIRVIMYDQRSFVADVEAIDTDNDYALLKINARNLPFLKLNSAEKIRSGNWVIAMGYPFKTGPIATFGIVSATGTTQPDSSYYSKYIQTDALFTPGISGGPLLNIDGKVIGINSAIFINGGVKSGIGLVLAISSIADSEIFKRYRENFK